MNAFHLQFCFVFFKNIFLKFIDSVKSLLGRHTKILIKYMVRLEIKADKTDNRVLVSNFVEFDSSDPNRN